MARTSDAALNKKSLHFETEDTFEKYDIYMHSEQRRNEKWCMYFKRRGNILNTIKLSFFLQVKIGLLQEMILSNHRLSISSTSVT